MLYTMPLRRFEDAAAAFHVIFFAAAYVVGAMMPLFIFRYALPLRYVITLIT